MAAEHDDVDGYVADEPYPSTFQRDFTPSWIDAMLRHQGWSPPRQPRAPFRLIDLGCGDGFGLIAQAAAHPEAEFVGIDAMADHIELGSEAVRRLGLTNIELRCARFTDVAAPAEPAFDYVIAQGVIAWVSEENRRHVYRIAREQLRPGGIACIGYNAMPGWKDLAAFQRLIRTLGEQHQGKASERFTAALAQVRALAEVGAAAVPAWVLKWIDDKICQLPPGYFGHEYLNAHWRPLWSAEVIEPMSALGFAYLAPAKPERLREDLSLTKAQRDALAGIEDVEARETAIDVITNCGFRIDIFGRGVERIADAQQARLDSWWAATVAEPEADYSCRTPAGTIRFDSAAAHAVLRGLANGPATLRSIHDAGEAGTIADVLNVADALLIAGHIVPVEPPAKAPDAIAANAAFADANGASGAIGCQIGRCGAVAVSRAVIASSRAPEDEKHAEAKRVLERFAVARE